MSLGGGGVDAENLKVVPDHCRSTIIYVTNILSVIRLMTLTYDLWASLSAPSELMVFRPLMSARSFLTLLSTDPSNTPTTTLVYSVHKQHLKDLL